MTFAQLLDNAKRRLDKNPAVTADETTARMKRFMNDRYREVMRIDGVGADLRDETHTVTATPGTPRLMLPPVARTISSVVDTTNRVKLQERTLSWIREQDPSVPAMVQGTPRYYAVLNDVGILKQPVLGMLTIASDNVADTRIFTIEGEQADTFTTFSGALTGTTPINIGLFWQRIYRLTVAAPTVPLTVRSTVQIRESPGLALVASLTNNPGTAIAGPVAVPPLFATSAWVLHLWPTPTSAIPYSIDYARPLYELTSDSDEPALPEDFHTLLVWGCCEEECLKMDDSRAKNYRAKWDEDIKALRAYLVRARGQRFIPRGRRQAAWNDLGPYFPSDV